MTYTHIHLLLPSYSLPPSLLPSLPPLPLIRTNTHLYIHTLSPTHYLPPSHTYTLILTHSGGEHMSSSIFNLKRMFGLIDRVGCIESLKIGWGLYIR